MVITPRLCPAGGGWRDSSAHRRSRQRIGRCGD